MENSKKPPARSDTAAQLRQAVLDSLTELQAGTGRIALALSGGLDSSVLLDVLAGLGRGDLVALHVHHGLSPNADAWLAHCQAECARLQVAFDHVRLDLQPEAGQSLEAQARSARYAALQTLCARHGATVLLTAHHGNDQAETLLLNLLRGAGIAGLAAMRMQRPLGALTLLRPFLHTHGELLREHAREQAISHIEDESNQQTHHTRNAIRLQLMPALRAIAPAAVQRLIQTASHAGQAQTLLDEIAQTDLSACAASKHSLNLIPLRTLSRARAANALRAWLRQNGRQAPSTATLNNMLDQINVTSSAARQRFEHDGMMLHVYRNTLLLDPLIETPQSELRFQWQGQERIDFPEWSGSLCFRSTDANGVSAAWLRNQALRLTGRSGGERLKLHPARPTRSLKHLYQSAAIPSWQRPSLPLLHAGPHLLLAAGLGMNALLLQSTDDQIELHWQPTP